LWLKCSSAGEKIEDENDDCQYKKNVNPAAKGITAYQPHNPKNEKNDGDSPEHLCSPFVFNMFVNSNNVYPSVRCRVPRGGCQCVHKIELRRVWIEDSDSRGVGIEQSYGNFGDAGQRKWPGDHRVQCVG
jgi:hypothetical protein